MHRIKELSLFLLSSLLTCLAVFQDALWGHSIAAPLDIAPALWKHYAHVDPAQGPIPKNHYTVDQLSYDLPLQFLMHQAWRSGEIPWWNPYSAGGRPLLADAHCNGTDPVRLLVYLAVPDFVLAYNWTLILHAIGTGLGVYVLLRAFGTRPWVAGICALAAQWAGGHVLYIGHPWVRGSFLYYPWLWLAWHRAFQSGRSYSCSAAWLTAAVFYAGNLQSHTYLPVCAVCALAGYAGSDWRAWTRGLKVMVLAGVLGAMLATPALLPQIELYLHAARPIGESPKLYWLETGAVLGAIHPWIAGTFRTISIKSVSGGPSFHLAIGGVLVLLATFSWMRRKTSGAHRRVLMTAGWLMLAFLLIVFTPLHPILYLRAAGLGILGLVVLAAWGLEGLLSSEIQSEVRWGRGVLAIAALIAVGSGLLAHAIYPRFQPRVEAMLLDRSETDGYGGASREFRKFQAANFTAEVSPLNPECALNLAGVAMLGLALIATRGRPRLLFAACVFSTISLLWFAERFITRSPTVMWMRLVEGGPAQRAVLANFLGKNARFADAAPLEYLRIFPQELASLHRLHVAHGYAALIPQAVYYRPNSTVPLAGSELPSETRYYWENGLARKLLIPAESLNNLQLSWEPSESGIVVRTDTWFPGWSAGGESLRPVTVGSPLAAIATHPHEAGVRMEYVPSNWLLSLVLAGTAATLSIGLALARGAEIGERMNKAPCS